MAGPMNTSPGGWQNYQPNPSSAWIAQGPNGQATPFQNNFGQNGGNMVVQQQEPPFVGRFINQIGEVVPREVPMDGRLAIFPTQNLEEIYLKAWDRYGTIKTFRYILDPNQNLNAQQPQGSDMSSQILERLDNLEQKLGESQQQLKNNNRRNTSKGGDENA